jgi:hypothetical protein
LENEFVVKSVRSFTPDTGILQFWDQHTMGLRTYKVAGEGASKIILH